MMNTKNFTPHTVHVFNPEGLPKGKISGEFILPAEGAIPFLSIPSDGVARVVFGKPETLGVTPDGIPIRSRARVVDVQIPPFDGVAIVSTMVAEAAAATRGLMTPAGLVRDAEGRVVGCTALTLW